jgi:uncharacterized membrane protein
MTLRSPRERILQTLVFEAGGLLLCIPLYSLYSGVSASGGAGMMAVLSAAVMIWSSVHNTVFDFIDLRLHGRVASDRTRSLRIVHAISHEVTAVAVTLPLLVWLGGHSIGDALIVNLWLTVLFTAYAFVFHLHYDRLRPVIPPDRRNSGNARGSEIPAIAPEMTYPLRLVARTGRGEEQMKNRT